MKIFTAAIFACTVLLSCSKQFDLPANSESAFAVSNAAEKTRTEVIFKVSNPQTIFLSQVRNTIQSDSFSVSGGNIYVSSFLFIATGSPNLVNPTFYLNGGLVKTFVTYSNDSILVDIKRPVSLTPGSYNYILQSKTVGESGSTFSITLNSVVMRNDKGRKIEAVNLPQPGNNFVLN